MDIFKLIKLPSREPCPSKTSYFSLIAALLSARPIFHITSALKDRLGRCFLSKSFVSSGDGGSRLLSGKWGGMAIETVKILGIDTSLRSTGVGIIEARGSALRAVAYGCIRNKPKDPHSVCLENIFNSISDVIEEHRPDCAAIEGAFFAKNANTAMVLGQARGAAITACAKKGLMITEHSPRKVKQAVVGNGSAQKDQVAKMIQRLLGLTEQPQADAADALAIAVCRFHQLSLPEAMQAKQI